MFQYGSYSSGLTKTPPGQCHGINMCVRFVAERLLIPVLAIALVLEPMTFADASGEHAESRANGSLSITENQTYESTPSLPREHNVAPGTLLPPEDPCLSQFYGDWYDYNRQARGGDVSIAKHARIVIDRSMFNLQIEQCQPGSFMEEIYSTPVALGDLRSPTPEGTFIINHVYCYPDVLFFSSSQEAIPNLYNGFFAPLLECDVKGNCRRLNDLGIHGFTPEARPDSSIRPETFGAVSAGCVRLPDPCTFKRHLLRRVELGPLRRNDRGSYHWLKRPLEVIIVNGYSRIDPTAGFLDSLASGLGKIGAKLQEIFRPSER